MTKARAVPMPDDSVLAPLHANAHLLDAFAIRLLAATVVHCHNRLGRAYLATIAPFHRAIVRATLERTARTLAPQARRR